MYPLQIFSGPMEAGNISKLSELFLMGLTEDPQFQSILFGLFFSHLYIHTGGNPGPPCPCCDQPLTHFHVFPPWKSVCLDFCYCSVTFAKMEVVFFSGYQTISFGCVQASCFLIFDVTEFSLLASMAHDSYVAICTSLLYHTAMSPRLHLQLVAASYVVGLMNIVLLTSTMFHPMFHKFHVITHCFCGIPPFLKLSCSDKQALQLIFFACGGFNVSVSLTIILVSYTHLLGYHKNLLSLGQTQNILHLCFLPDRCQPVVGNHSVHLLVPIL